MKTEQILLILAGFYFLQQMRRTQAQPVQATASTPAAANQSAGNQASNQSMDTSNYFDPAQTNGQSGGDASRQDNSWDAQTKPARDAIGSWLCQNVSGSLPGCP
jgi:hypothetical protein